MGVYTTNNIVTNNLILNLDGGNFLSYPKTGTAWNDLSGNNNTATLYGSPSYNTSNNGCLQFTANSAQYGIVTNSPSLNNWNAFTISVWFKTTGGMQQYARLFEKGANNELTIVFNATPDTNKLSVQNVGGTNILLTSAVAYNDNIWHNVTVTITSGYYVTMYIDGGSFIVGNQSPTTPTKTNDINIGRYGGGLYYYNGFIGNIALYNRDLTPSEILQNYNALKTRYGK